MNKNFRLRARNESTNKASAVAIAVFVMYAVTAVLLIILSFLLYKLNLSETVIRIGILVVYVVAGFVGGYFIGKKMKQKRYLWGMFAGALYFVLLFVLSLVVKKGMGLDWMADPIRILATLVLCAISGMTGGMLS